MLMLDNVTKVYGGHYIFKNYTFEFPENCSIGLLGKNGAGKSTLMRLLSGIELPNSGELKTDKRISWPVGLTGGFQKELSAADNVRFVARVYGFWGDDMLEKVKFVRDFAGIGIHFDRPVSTYSSGMRARVGLGLSMAFDFDYYLVDEADAVGDASFRAKRKELYTKKLETANIIMVSHNMAEIEELCDKILLLNAGKITVYDDVAEGIKAYNEVCK